MALQFFAAIFLKNLLIRKNVCKQEITNTLKIGCITNVIDPWRVDCHSPIFTMLLVILNNACKTGIFDCKKKYSFQMTLTNYNYRTN